MTNLVYSVFQSESVSANVNLERMLDSISVAAELQGSARVGILQIDGVRVRETPIELKDQLNGIAEDYARRYKDQALGEIPTVRQIRAIFHRTGLDPTRYRPSSESLLRRAVKGKGLYFINSVVDLVNYFSLKLLWPIGLYDADQLRPPIEWRAGREGESYEGIGRDRLNLAHFPLLVDRESPFGSPISDSMRTRVGEACSRILWVTFAPPQASVPNDEFAEAMIRYNGGVVNVSKEI
jgi:DNA/RNA-binding domain of Phe-tRNA-synthetase-like protein